MSQGFFDRIKPLDHVVYAPLEVLLTTRGLPDVCVVHALLSQNRAKQGVEFLEPQIFLTDRDTLSVLTCAGWVGRGRGLSPRGLQLHDALLHIDPGFQQTHVPLELILAFPDLLKILTHAWPSRRCCHFVTTVLSQPDVLARI